MRSGDLLSPYFFCSCSAWGLSVFLFKLPSKTYFMTWWISEIRISSSWQLHHQVEILLTQLEFVVINMFKKNTLSVFSSIWQWNNSPGVQVSCWIQDLHTLWVSARSANSVTMVWVLFYYFLTPFCEKLRRFYYITGRGTTSTIIKIQNIIQDGKSMTFPSVIPCTFLTEVFKSCNICYKVYNPLGISPWLPLGNKAEKDAWWAKIQLLCGEEWTVQASLFRAKATLLCAALFREKLLTSSDRGLRFKGHMGFLEEPVKKDNLKLSNLSACIFGHSYALKAHASHSLKCGG